MNDLESNLQKKGNETVKAAGVVSFATLLSRISGLFRDQIVAALVKTTLSDPFFLAFRIPNFLRAIFAEGAMSSAFIPIFNETLIKEDKRKSREFFSAIFTIIFFLTAIISIIGIIASPLIIKVYAFGWTDDNPQSQYIATSMLKNMFPYICFISIAALFMGALNSLKHFFVPAFSPTLLNISMIAGLPIGLYMFERPLEGLAWGVIIGGILQAVSQLVILVRKNFIPYFTFSFLSDEVKKVFKLALTAALGASVFQINSGIDTLFATFLESGSVSYLYYGNRLIQFPLAFFAISIVVAYFPDLSKSASSNNIEGLKKMCKEGLDFIMFFIFPSMVTLIFLPRQILDLLFRHGTFDYDNLMATTLVVICYSLGLWGISGGKIYTRIFHSLQDMKSPVIIGLYATGINFVLNVILMQFISYAGLALATTISSTVQFYLLSRSIEKKIGKIKESLFDLQNIKFVIASVIMALFFYQTSNFFYKFNAALVLKAFHLFWIISFGWIIYFIISLLLGCNEPKKILEILKKKTR